MIYEQDINQEHNDFIDALEDADTRMQRVFIALAEKDNSM